MEIYMNDQKLVQEIRTIKQSHERFMTAILSCDVFPGLDKTNPLDSKEEDSIPEKFGSKWYEQIEKPQTKVYSKLINLDEHVDEGQLNDLLSEAEPN